jgi:hypothetical protein
MGLYREQESPDGQLCCVVEDDGSTVCLYLAPARNKEWVTKPVWVRNRIAAPARLSVLPDLPPLMPAACCRHPGGAGPLDESKLRFVWLPEGNGVALYEAEELLAAIPPGSGMDGFLGYARDAIGQGPLAWELLPENPLHARFAEARRYWDRWEESAWRKVQDRQIDAYERQLGKHTEYYAIDQGRWPPKAMLRIPYGDDVVLVSVGVCIRPQPNVELYDPSAWQSMPRIELGMVLRGGIGAEAIKRFMGYLSGQAGYPWWKSTWLSHGHSMPCDALKGTPYTHVLLANSKVFGPYVELDDQDDVPVWLLWMVPVTPEELQVAKEKRSDTVLSKVSYPR